MSTLNEALENFDLNEDTSDEALTCYQRVGNSLQLEKSVVELRRRIIEARNNPSTTPPFYFIEVPS